MTPRPNQFSLQQLLVSVAWFAAAFGVVGVGKGVFGSTPFVEVAVLLFPAFAAFFGAGIGHLLGDAIMGGVIGLAAGLVIFYLATAAFFLLIP